MISETPDAIAFVQLCARKGALSLELKGLRRHGRTAYAICKSEYGLKGSRKSVLAQMEALIEATIAKKHAAVAADAADVAE